MAKKKLKSTPDPTNKDRAKWANKALLVFAKEVGQEQDLKLDPSTVAGDFLADLMHWCNAHDIDFEDILSRGQGHYAHEIKEENDNA